MTKIGIINYGVGNLGSVQNAFSFVSNQGDVPKFEVCIESSPEKLKDYDKLLLPGVGAFGNAMEHLRDSHLDEAIKEFAQSGKYLLGICLGMQLLFEKSFEFGEFSGLSLIKGAVRLMKPEGGLSVPQMGWNALEYNRECPLLEGIGAGKYVYFVHSYAADCGSDDVYAYADYGGKVPALVGNGFVYGAQFHPEKSGDTGLLILRNFAEL